MNKLFICSWRCVMRLLVLGGTHHVGRAVVEVGLGRGDRVTTLNRGVSREPEPGAEALIADADVSAALAAGLACRPIRETIADTWAWLQAEGDPPPLPTMPPPSTWLDPAEEQRVLALLDGEGGGDGGTDAR
jgi:NAD(P)-dependent dehydrogenase (short-subunit alcohol dehydrogenase family)